jgi:tetratricopeptide (TPR) repeat protein
MFFLESSRFWGVWALLLAFAPACSHTIEIKTSPAGAEVRLAARGKQSERVLGVTPLRLALPADGNLAHFEVTLTGSRSRSVLLPLTPNEVSKVSLDLSPIDSKWFESELLKSHPEVLSQAMEQIFAFQRVVLKGDSKEVETLVPRFQLSLGRVSVFHSLLGNHYFLKNEREKAKSAYSRALELDPNNAEARQVLQLLQKRE